MKRIVTAACAILLMAACTSEKKENQTLINTGESLFETVKQFVQLGEHRTATSVDSSTSAWLKSEFDSLGAKTEFVEFPLSQFFFEEGKLTYDSQTVAVFPVWPVREGLQLSLSGSVIAGDQLKKLTDVKGKIVLTHLTHQHGASTPEIKTQIDTFIHAGAIAVLVVPENNTGEIVALNTFEDQKAWDVPVYEIAPKDTGIVLKSISDKKTLAIEVKGSVRQITGRSVLAKLGTGKQYVVISTPISGWFRTGGERGPGIAVWLGLAKWVKANAQQFKDYTFLFIGNSGHELSNLGARVFADKAAPKIEDTRLWIHLGAAVAVREWKEEKGQWTLTDSVDSKRSIYYDEAVAKSFEKSFEQLKAKKVKGTEENKATVKPGGEGIVYQQHGYKNLVSIAYGHRLHHVKTDDEQSTSPELLLELEQTLEQFITLELAAK
ncbi:MAG: hypothetical protein JWO58_2363 [Chitinophagaceae bacterium]|nr:hypothetical protein [Chitinophagaceae bacterium]